MSQNIHSLKIKEQILSESADVRLPQVKLVEMLLYYTNPEKDTASIARELIRRFGSLSGVIDAEIDELMKVEGVGPNTASHIKLMKPLCREYVRSQYSSVETLKSPEEIGDYIFNQYFGLMGENFSILYLNRLGKIISFEIVAKGSIDSVGVSPRMVVEKVVKNNATAIVIAHNHPGGVALPSREDIEITKRIAEVLKGISVNLLDHIIIGDDDYVSMASSAKLREIFE